MVNPWGLIVVSLGILMIILGVKGSYGNVVNALKSGGSSTTAHGPVVRPRPALA